MSIKSFWIRHTVAGRSEIMKHKLKNPLLEKIEMFELIIFNMGAATCYFLVHPIVVEQVRQGEPCQTKYSREVISLLKKFEFWSKSGPCGQKGLYETCFVEEMFLDNL